ncbi:MAG: prephenate dehydratase [Solirubrobacteraceae bacterium]
MSHPGSALPRAGYLGPEGTFSEEALLGSVLSSAVLPVALETIRDAVMAVQEGSVEWALVPIENSIEGSVTVTLDTLAAQAGDVEIVGEWVLPVRHYLIARESIEFEQIGTVVSHPHVPGQCRHFLHERLPHAHVTAASSTAEAVRLVAEHADTHVEGGGGDDLWAAIGTRLAAELYGCVVIAEGIQDREDNETRFVWLALKDTPAGSPPLRAPSGPGRKTSLVFWGSGAGQAGWLVLCLDEFARRQINLTKIESRPMRERLGQYMFFVDLDGSLTEPRVREALAGLRALCEHVRVLGSYPTA